MINKAANRRGIRINPQASKTSKAKAEMMNVRARKIGHTCETRNELPMGTANRHSKKDNGSRLISSFCKSHQQRKRGKTTTHNSTGRATIAINGDRAWPNRNKLSVSKSSFTDGLSNQN